MADVDWRANLAKTLGDSLDETDPVVEDWRSSDRVRKESPIIFSGKESTLEDRINRSLRSKDVVQQETLSRGWWGDMGHAASQGLHGANTRLLATAYLAGAGDHADRIAEHYRLSSRPEYVREFLAELQANEGKFDRTEGFWPSVGAFGEMASDIATDPKGLSYVIMENLANWYPSLGLGVVGAGTAAVATAWTGPGVAVTATTGFIVGMSLGTILTETGGKVMELLQVHGANMKDANSIRAVMNSEGFRGEAAKKGLIKGTTIAAIDAITFKLGGKIVTAPARQLDKSITKVFADEGIDTATASAKTIGAALKSPELKAKLAPAIERYLVAAGVSKEGVKRVTLAGERYTARSTRGKKIARGAAFFGMEVTGEGIGEYSGEHLSEGKGKAGEALLESFAAVGQSGVQIAIAQSLAGTYKGSKAALQRISREQTRKVAKGEDSGFDPSDLNAARAKLNAESVEKINVVDERVAPTVTADIGEYEGILADSESRDHLDAVIGGLEESAEYAAYQAELHAALRDGHGDTVTIYVPVTPEDQASLDAGPPTVTEKTEAAGKVVTETGPAANAIDDIPNIAVGTRVRMRTQLDSDEAGNPVGDLWAFEGVVEEKEVDGLVIKFIRASRQNQPKKAIYVLSTDGVVNHGISDVTRVEEEEAAPASALEGYIVGSIDRAGAPSRTGTNVVRVSVPVEAVVARGNSGRGQIVVDATKVTPSPLVDEGGIETTLEAREGTTLLSVAERRAAQIKQEEQLETLEGEFDVGQREIEVEESQKFDADKATRKALNENKRQLNRVPNIKELNSGKTADGRRVTKPSLARTIVQNDIPTTDGGRGVATGDKDTLIQDVKDYRQSLEKPHQMGRVNKVIGKLGYRLSARGKNKEVTLIDESGNRTGLGTTRVQDRTISQYLDLVEEQIADREFQQEQEVARAKEERALKRVVVREKKRGVIRGKVGTNLEIIKQRFFESKDGKVEIDEAGLERYLTRVKEAGEWKSGELTELDRGINRLREESRIAGESREPSRPVPRHTVVAGTKPTSEIPGLKKIARLAGNKLRQFHARAIAIIRTGTRDELLGKIAGVFVPHAKIGATGEGGTISPNTILVLSRSTDRKRVARAYALSTLYIFSQPSITWSRPDNSLDVDAESTSLGAHLNSGKILNDSQFGKLYKEVQRLLGPDATLIRISQKEFIIHNDSISKSQFARRMGRLQARFGKTYGFEAEFFTATSEKITHNWNEDPLGAGLRHQIREAGFADLLPYLDNRRDAFLELAASYGARTEDLKFVEPTTPSPTPSTPTPKIPNVKFSMPENRILPERDSFGLFSATESFLQNWGRKSGTGNEIIALLRKAGGVEFAEAQEMGLTTYLEVLGKRSITKEELLAFVRNNKVRLAVTVREDYEQFTGWLLGDLRPHLETLTSSNFLFGIHDIVVSPSGFYDNESAMVHVEVDREIIDQAEELFGTSWEPMGTGEIPLTVFREMLEMERAQLFEIINEEPEETDQPRFYILDRANPDSRDHLPVIANITTYVQEVKKADRAIEAIGNRFIEGQALYTGRTYRSEYDGGNSDNPLHIPGGHGHSEFIVKLDHEQAIQDFIDRINSDEELSAFDKTFLLSIVDGKEDSWTHLHWPDEKNPIAHFRAHQREAPSVWEGIRQFFHIDEIQSDRHHKAREKGMAGREPFVDELILSETMVRAWRRLAEASSPKPPHVYADWAGNIPQPSTAKDRFGDDSSDARIILAEEGNEANLVTIPLFSGWEIHESGKWVPIDIDFLHDQLQRNEYEGRNFFGRMRNTLTIDNRITRGVLPLQRLRQMTSRAGKNDAGLPQRRRSVVPVGEARLGTATLTVEERAALKVYINAYNALVTHQHLRGAATQFNIPEGEIRNGDFSDVRGVTSLFDSFQSRVGWTPFKDSWQALIMKHALVHAANTGHNVVTWISGEQSGKRYKSLAKIQKLRARWDQETDRYSVTWTTIPGNETTNNWQSRISLTEEELKNTLGNKLANRIIKDSRNGTIEIPRVSIHPYTNVEPNAKERYEVRVYAPEISEDVENTWSIFNDTGTREQAEASVERYLSLAGAKQVLTNYDNLSEPIGADLHRVIYDSILPKYVRRLIKKYPGSTLELVSLPVEESAEPIKMSAEPNTIDGNFAIYDISDENSTSYKFKLTSEAVGLAGEAKTRISNHLEFWGDEGVFGGNVDASDIKIPDNATLDEAVGIVQKFVEENRRDPYQVWRLDMTDEMRNDLRNRGLPMYSMPYESPMTMSDPKPTAQPSEKTAADARVELVSRYGEDNIRNLEESGVLKIVDGVDGLPVGLNEGKYSSAEGIYDGTNSVAYLIASNIKEGGASGVLMHEVGVHFGLRRMVGGVAFDDILQRLLSGKESAEFKPYFDRVKSSYEALLESGDVVEDSEEFLEEVLAKIAQDKNAQDMGLLQELYGRIRVFLSKYFKGIDLNTSDLQALVRGSLRKSMRGEIDFRGQLIRDSVFASFVENNFTRVGNFYNILTSNEDVYKPSKFPNNPTGRVDKASSHASFSHKTAEGSFAKAARKKMVAALVATEKMFYDMGIKGAVIDFPSERKGTMRESERLVRIRMGDEMLTIRFGFAPIDPNLLAMIGPIVDFGNMGRVSGDGSISLAEITSDIKKALELFSQGKLKESSGYKMALDHKLGLLPDPATTPGWNGRESYETYTVRLWRDLDPGRGRLMIEHSQVGYDYGFITKDMRAPNYDKKGVGRKPIKYYSMPDDSENDLATEDKVLMNRVTGRTKRRGLFSNLEESRGQTMLWLSQGLVDKYRSVRNRLGEAGEQAWMMMHLSDNVPNLIHAVLQYGRPTSRQRDGKFDGYDIDPNTAGLIEIMWGLEGEVDRFLSWIVGHRSAKLMKEGREKNFSEEDIKRLKNFARGTTASGKQRHLLYAQTMRELGKFQSSILDLSVEAGIISKEDRPALASDFYVPFYRYMETARSDTVRGPAMTGSFVNIKDVVHELKGSELETNDVLHNLLMNWAALLGASMKNRAGTAAVEAAVKIGVARLVEDKKEASQIAFGKSKTSTNKFENYIYILKDGKKVWYEVSDNLVLKSLLSLNWSGIDNGWMKAASTFKRWFTLGVTASPAFKIRNLVRDSVHTIAVGETSYNIFGNVAKGLKRAQVADPVYQSMLASGGAFSFGFLHDDPSAIRRLLRRGVKQANVLDTSKKGLGFARKLWDGYGEVGNRMENANRVALYLNRVDEVGHMQASFEARDLLNFSSHGSFLATQYLIGSIPFLNARIQGLSKIGRAVGGDQRGRAMVVVGSLILASVLYELSMDDDEEYKRLPDWVRDTYWPVKMPGDDAWFYIPKPFEIGAIASVAQRFTQTFVDESANPAFFAKRVGEILMDQLAFDWRPQIVRPALEVGFNYDSFRNKSIESLGKQLNTPKHRRITATSSDFSIVSSQAFQDWFGGTPLSPVQIDHLIKGYFGWLGATIVGAADFVLYPSEPEQPTKRWDEMYGLVPIGSFYKEGPPKTTKQMQLFWEQLKEIKEHHNIYKDYLTRGLDDELKEYLAKNRQSLIWRKHYEKMQRHLGKINKRMTQVYDSTDMTADEKRVEIDRLIEMKNKSAERIINMRERAEKRSNQQSSFSIISSAKADSGEDVETDYDVQALQKAIQTGDLSAYPRLAGEGIVGNLYNSIMSAEFRGARGSLGSKFIRTRHAPAKGSTAYGPLQITLSLMTSGSTQLDLTDKESDYVVRFKEQARLFLKYGNEPDKEGYHSRYDYGGSGDLTSDEDKALYESVGRKLIQLVLDQSGNDTDEFINQWRYGKGNEGDVSRDDEKYYAAFKEAYR